MLASKADITVIDFETTGVVGDLASEPWQIGMTLLHKGKLDSSTQYNKLLRVGDRPFNPAAPGVHHKLRRQIADAETLQQLWPELEGDWLNRPLAAHNIAVEKNILHQAAPLHTFGPWIDTLKLSRVAYPDLESHTLGDVLTRLKLMEKVCGDCPGLEPHDAFFDAVGCAVLLEHLLTLPGWETVTLEALETVQAEKYHQRVNEEKRRLRG